MGSESNQEKLKNLEIVAAIVNKLDGDLNQLKLWIKTQFDTVSVNESSSPAPFNRNIITPGPSNYTPNYSLRSANRQINETQEEYILGDCTFSQVSVNEPADDSSVNVLISDEDMDPLDPLNHVKVEMTQSSFRQNPRFTPNSNRSQVSQFSITNGESSGAPTAATSNVNSAPNKARVSPKNCPFICEICRNRFTTKLSLDKHRDLHQRGWRWNCSKCKRKFKTREDLKNHTSIYHWEAGIKIKKVSSVPEKPKKSNVRPVQSTSSTLQIIPKQEQSTTPIRSKNSSKPSSKRVLTPRKSVPVPVPGTSNSTPNSDGVRKRQYFLSKPRTMPKSRPKTYYNCGECLKIFKDLPQLKLHEKAHVDSIEFKCSLCPNSKDYKSKKNLTRHRTVMHGISKVRDGKRNPGLKVTCQICGGTYAGPSFKNHLQNTHLVCSSINCERSFEDKQTLLSHKRIHHPNKARTITE